MERPPVTLSEVVATLAIATDVAMGHPLEQGLGSCIVATRLGELAGLSKDELSRTYFVALLRHIGCTVENDGLAALVGDEIAFSAEVDALSGAKGSEYIAAFARFATVGKPPIERVRALGRLAVGLRSFRAVNQAICEVAKMLASRLGLDDATVAAVGTVYERWDGKGMPNRLRGEAIPRPVRIAQIADLLAALHDLQHDDPVGSVRGRGGSGFDPDLVALVDRHADELLELLAAPSRWEAVQRCQPTGGTILRGERLDAALHVMGDFADLKSRYLVGHSSGVASLACAAAERLGLSDEDARRAEHAALVHDVGRVGVSVAIWDKPAALTASEWEAVRLHAYHTDRILARSPFLAWIASAASMHHERLDGSGYFRGVAQTEPVAKLLAVADAYHAMIEPRPTAPPSRMTTPRTRFVPRCARDGWTGRRWTRSCPPQATGSGGALAIPPVSPAGRSTCSACSGAACRTARSRGAWSSRRRPSTTMCSRSIRSSASPRARRRRWPRCASACSIRWRRPKPRPRAKDRGSSSCGRPDRRRP